MLPDNTFNKIRELFVTESFQNFLRVSVSPVFPFFFSEKKKKKKTFAKYKAIFLIPIISIVFLLPHFFPNLPKS